MVSNAGIDATLTAGFTPDPEENGPEDSGDGLGSIQSVRAWDDIDGTLTATDSIDGLVAGGEVNATLSAPSIGTITEDNRSEFTFWDQPHEVEFDWLGALAADMAHGDALLREAIAASVTASHNATGAARAGANKELADTIDFLAIAHTAATASASASAQATQLSSAAADALDGAAYVATGVTTSIRNVLSDMTADEDGREKLVTHAIAVASHQMTVDLMLAQSSSSTLTTNAASLSTTISTLYQQVSSAEVSKATSHATVAANQQSEYYQYTLLGMQENFWNSAGDFFNNQSIAMGDAAANSSWSMVRGAAGIGSISAAILGSLSHSAAGVASLGDIPRQYNNLVYSYQSYASIGIDAYSATMLMFNPMTGLFEAYDGVSYQANDFSRQLDPLERGGRALESALNTAGVALGGVAGLRSLSSRVAPNSASQSVGSLGIAEKAIAGEIGFVERVTLQLKARYKYGAKPKIMFGQAKDQFVRNPTIKRDHGTIELVGSQFGKHSRGTFYEELQHAIDNVVGVNPRRFPTPGSLDDAKLHLEVFERLIANPIFKLNPVEKLNLIGNVKKLIVSLGG